MVLGLAPLADNEAKAKDMAVKDAIKRAVARVALSMVDPATMRDKLPELLTSILSEPGRFVAAYTPQSAAVQDKIALAMVSVSVDQAALDLALSQSGLRLPAARLAVTLMLVSEEAAPGRPPVYWWSGAAGLPQAPPPLDQVLKSLGVKLADIKALSGRVPLGSRQPVLSEDQAIELARLAGAGLVIMGRVRTYPMVTPEDSPQPLVQLLALEPGTGKTLAMEEVTGPVYHTTPGPGAADQVNLLVEQAMRRLLEQVAANASAGPSQVSEITIKLSGVRGLADLHRFEQVLESLKSLVDSVNRQSVGAGGASLRVRLKVPAAQLADQLLLQNYGTFLVNVAQSGPDSLNLVLIPK